MEATSKAMEVKKVSKQKQRALEGLCPTCGEFAYPYYYCNKHRIYQNVKRVLKKFETIGWVDVDFDSDGEKIYKWNHKAPERIRKEMTPKQMAMQLPRINGRPMTQNVIGELITKVLEVNQVPMTRKEIEKGIKSLKTIGKIIPDHEGLIAEYKLIKEKKSNLSKAQRNGVEYKINFLIQRGVIQESQIIFEATSKR